MRLIYSVGSMTFDQVSYPAQAAPLHDAMQLFRAHDCLLILEGGADIHPRLYGEENLFSGVSVARDSREVALFRLAREYNVPILGLCRGHQLINAMMGGTLYQDLREQYRGNHPGIHNIIYTEAAIDTGFTEVMQSCPYGPFTVNSLHHQGIKDLAVGAEVLAYAPDGLVEAAIYHKERMLSTQWHPEFLDHIEMLAFVERLWF